MAKAISKSEELIKQIQKKAYELFLSRGQAPGNALEDWLKAEKEVLKKASTTTTATAKKPVKTKA